MNLLTGAAGGDAATGGANQINLAELLPEGWENNGGVVTRTIGTLLSNPFFSAGAGLWVLTAAGAAARKGAALGNEFVKRRFRLSLEVNNTDGAFMWLLKWLSEQPSFRTNRLSVMGTTQYNSIAGNRHSLIYGPAIGVTHYFFINGWPITLVRTRNEQRNMDGEIFESLQLATYGINPSIFTDMMEAARKKANEAESGRTKVLVNKGSYWGEGSSLSRASRPLASVVLAKDTSERIVTDVRQFIASESYYRNLGVPYRRGYLLHGPPGCGKTSLVMALAGELGLSISILSLSARSVNDETLMSLMNSVQAGSMVLLEDIDRAFATGGSVTMSGLLNALDGISAQEGSVVFMTTNHVERLDPALIRPGRVDMKVEIGLMDIDQGVRLFNKFFPDAGEELQKKFAAVFPPNALSAAELQSHLFFYRNSPVEATEQLDSYIRSLHTFEEKVSRLRSTGAGKEERSAEETARAIADLPRSTIL